MTPSGPMVGPASTSQRLACGPTPTLVGHDPIWKRHRVFCAVRSSAYRWSSSEPTYATPDADSAGELNTRSPVGNTHSGLPALSTTCTRPSWLPTSTAPSETAGDEVIGP